MILDSDDCGPVYFGYCVGRLMAVCGCLVWLPGVVVSIVWRSPAVTSLRPLLATVTVTEGWLVPGNHLGGFSASV